MCYNEAVRQRRDYKEKPKEAKPLTRKAKRLLLKVKRDPDALLDWVDFASLKRA